MGNSNETVTVPLDVWQELLAFRDDLCSRFAFAEEDLAHKVREAFERGMQENARFREALEWYAKEKNYDDNDTPGTLHQPSVPVGASWHGDEEPWWESDCGQRARTALAGHEEQEPKEDILTLWFTFGKVMVYDLVDNRKKLALYGPESVSVVLNSDHAEKIAKALTGTVVGKSECS